jgi:hypothetical protein
VETPVEALGCSTENYREEDPPDDTTDQKCQRWRQVRQCPRKDGSDDSAAERNSGRD